MTYLRQFGQFVYFQSGNIHIPKERREHTELFMHEFGHCMELADRGQIHRLKIPNFGWPMAAGYFNKIAATAECRAIALQYLLEEYIFGEYQRSGILNIDAFSSFLSDRRYWRSFSSKELLITERQEWLDEKAAKTRILEYTEMFRPTISKRIEAVMKYINDNCFEDMLESSKRGPQNME